MKTEPAEILREYGPFPGADHVHGLTFDGQYVWFASGDKLNVLDPESGLIVRRIDAQAHAGTKTSFRDRFEDFLIDELAARFHITQIFQAIVRHCLKGLFLPGPGL